VKEKGSQFGHQLFARDPVQSFDTK